jgi:hypothetical protein
VKGAKNSKYCGATFSNIQFAATCPSEGGEAIETDSFCNS